MRTARDNLWLYRLASNPDQRWLHPPLRTGQGLERLRVFSGRKIVIAERHIDVPKLVTLEVRSFDDRIAIEMDLIDGVTE